MTPCALRMLGAAALLATAGCVVPTSSLQTGRGLGRGDAEIVRGRTTKAQLLDRLGAPDAIAAAGEYVSVPAAAVEILDEMDPGQGHRLGGGSYPQQGDAWLRFFETRRPISDRHRVYYWYTTSSRTYLWVGLLFGVVTSSESMDELWALVDEETGSVDDAFFLSR